MSDRKRSPPNGIGTAPITVVATNTSGLSATLSYTLTVHANVPPTITSPPPVITTAGAPFQYDIIGSDLGDTMTYSLPQAPAGMTVDSLGRITWNPTIADIGTVPIVVDVANSGGLTATQSFNLIVAADTLAPSIIIRTVPASQVPIGKSFTVQAKATDNVGVTSLTLSATFGGVTTPIALLPDGTAKLTYNTAGLVSLVATATDAAGNVGTATTSMLVVDPSVTLAPVTNIASPSDGANLTAPVPVIGTVSDPSNALVSWTLAIAPDTTGELGNVGGSGPQPNTTPTVLATGTNPVINGTLGTLDTTLLANGSYKDTPKLKTHALSSGALINAVTSAVMRPEAGRRTSASSGEHGCDMQSSAANDESRITNEQRPRSFAIVRMDDSDLDIPAVARLIAELLDFSLVDLIQVLPQRSGILAENLAEQVAARCVAVLAAAGIDVRAVPQSAVIEPPEVVTLRSGRADEDVFFYVASDRKGVVKWPDVLWVDFVTIQEFQKQGYTDVEVDPGGEGEPVPLVSQHPLATKFPLFLDLVTYEPWLLLRISDERFEFTTTGLPTFAARRDNLIALSAAIAERAIKPNLGPGLKWLDSGSPRQPQRVANPAIYSGFLRWQLTRLLLD